MDDPEQLQISFDVGGATPQVATLKLSGHSGVHRELKKGEEIHLSVADADGAIVASAYGTVTQVAFKDKRDKDGYVTATERIHTVSMS